MKNRILSGLLIAFMAVVVMGCDKDDDTIVDPPVTQNPTFSSTNVKEGAVYYSVDTKQEVTVWDLVFKSNGPSPDFYLNPAKINGTQQVLIYNTEATDFDAVTSITPASLTSDADTNVAGGNWYNYDMNTHTISTKGFVYIIRDSRDNIYKLRIENYASSVFTLKFARYNTTTNAFETAQTATVDKTAGAAMFSIAKGLVTAQKDWDLKLTVVPTEIPQAGVILFPGILLNTEKNVAVKIVTDKTFANVNAATETGLVTDTPEHNVIGTDWFDYNEQTHRITSKNHTYVLQTASGKRSKFHITNYYNSNNQSGYITFEYTEAK